MPVSRACHGCPQTSDLSGQGVGNDKVAIFHFGGGSILSWRSPIGILISRAMMKGPRQTQTDELIKLYKENNIYNFYVKDLDGNWQAQNVDTGVAESVFPRRYAKSVQQLSGGSWQAEL